MSEPVSPVTFTERDGVWHGKLTQLEYTTPKARKLRQTIGDWLKDKPSPIRVVLDCAATEMLSFEALTALSLLGKACTENGGKLAVYGLTDHLVGLLQGTRTTDSLTIAASEKDARTKVVA